MAASVLGALLGEARRHPGDPLVVSSAARAEAQFESDRGLVLLPAWKIAIDDVPGVFVVLDPEVVAQAWPADGAVNAGHRGYDVAYGDTDGSAFTLSFVGSPHVYTDHRPPLRVHGSPGAVVVGLPVAIDISGGGPRELYAQRREVTVEFRESLGDRVLVNPFGLPVPVLHPR
jgi:hypothetical protein